MINPALIEALGSVAVAVVGSSLVAPFASYLKSVVGARERTVIVKLPSGAKVSLELDQRLSQKKVSELVAAAVQSAQAGDEAAIQRTVKESRAASQQARITAAH